MDWIVMTQVGNAFIEAWRGPADSWFAAVESVDASKRTTDMFVIPLDSVRPVRLVDRAEGLSEPVLVKVLPDGSLRRARLDAPAP